jgi:hypothetical protein
MKTKKYYVFIAALLLIAITIHLLSSNSARVEEYYSSGIYQYIAVFLRYIFGWLPFSLGDILYGLVFLWLIVAIVIAVKVVFRKAPLKIEFLPWMLRWTVKILIIYILFNVLWGINYNRKGIAGQLGLKMEKYTVDDLKTINALLLQRVNASSNSVLQKPLVKLDSEEIFSRSQEAYKALHAKYGFMNYQPSSIKSSMWGWLGNYLGYMGYYNPFTGEGQVNTTIPLFLQPFTSCHEIAHQLGYAKENEANFVGYLAAISSKDEFFHYSVYLDLFIYANRNLYHSDSAAANEFTKQLLPAVKNDLIIWRKFNQRHKNPVEPVIRWMYGKYLENNQQPSGMLSYDEVNGFLVAYYKKYGKL